MVGALTASEAALKIQRQVYASRQDPTAKAALVNALGENSFYLLFNRRAEEAAARAEEALSLDPSAVWIETNRAHAYLFLGRYEQAKAIYLENKDKLLITAEPPFSKRYLKYLTKKYLKKNNIRDYLHVIASDKTTYQIKYFNIQNEEGEEESE